MSEVKRYWIYKGTSNFCQNLTLDDDCETMVRQKPDGFYDIVSTNDTVEGGVEVVLASDYEKLKAQLERAEKVLDFYSDCGLEPFNFESSDSMRETITQFMRDTGVSVRELILL